MQPVLSTSSLTGNSVVNRPGEDLGTIEDVTLDTETGNVAYAVLSFGGFLGMGDKLFAIPWNALELDSVNKRFILDTSKDRLERAPGFNKDNWPNMADRTWGSKIHTHYSTQPYWK